MAVPINELTDALGRAGTPGTDFTISNDIFNMFRSDDDSVGTTDDDHVQRFMAARELFQTARDNGATEAIFYKLHDKTTARANYSRNRLAIRDAFRTYRDQIQLNHRRLPNLGEKVDFFRQLRNRLDDKGAARTPDENIQLELARYWRNSPDLDKLANTEGVGDWFEAEKDKANSLAENHFFGINAHNGKAVGTIYNPTSHNWGTNVAWALSITRQGLPIRVISPLEDANTLRTSRPVPPPQPLPSAFALEMSVAIMMNYTLTFNANGTVELTPPAIIPNPAIDGVLTHTSVPPTANDQISIFRACVLDSWRNAGTLAANTNGFSLDNHKTWRQILTSPPLNNKATFDNLRAAMRTNQLTAVQSELNIKLLAGTLAAYINAICTGADAANKSALVDTLKKLTGLTVPTLNATLNVLSTAQLRDLRETLADPAFNAGGYDALKAAVKDKHLDKIVVDLGTKLAANDGSLRTHIEQICDNGSPTEKANLIDALEKMRVNHTLAGVRDALTSEQRNKLATLAGHAHTDLRDTIIPPPLPALHVSVAAPSLPGVNKKPIDDKKLGPDKPHHH